MSKKILNIIIDGKPIFNLNDKYNYITLSSKEPEKDQDQGKWLQIDYEKPEEIMEEDEGEDEGEDARKKNENN